MQQIENGANNSLQGFSCLTENNSLQGFSCLTENNSYAFLGYDMNRGFDIISRKRKRGDFNKIEELSAKKRKLNIRKIQK